VPPRPISAVVDILRWMQRHKAKSAGLVGAALLSAYATVFIAVGCSSSPTDQTVRLTDGRNMAYMRWNSDEEATARVVLVHGAPADASSWTRLRRQADLPAVEWIAVDRLGYGNSSRETESSLEEHARSLEPWLSDAPPRGVILVGHSYGGPVVLRAAADFPDRVRAIVLVAGACDAYMNDAQWFRRAVDGVSGAVPASWVAANRELLALTDENLAMETMLDRITCPVVIVHGTWDPVCPCHSTVAYLKSRLKNAGSISSVTLERVGHNIHLSHPERIAEEIECLLSSPTSVATGP
jgi:pimeloyl-ACP methyl ester carboxylesterase